MRQAAIERMLPAAYQRAVTEGSVLHALLAVMEEMHAPSEAVLEAVDSLINPYRTPDALVPFLIRWVALDHLVPGSAAGSEVGDAIPLGRLRDLVSRGARLAQSRGTSVGLRLVLETATGVTGFVIEEPADRPFHLNVLVPAAAVDQLDLVNRIVAAEKPAATTSTVVAPTPVSPSKP